MNTREKYENTAELRDFLAERYGWTPWDVARLHPSEVRQYLRGAEIRNEKQQRAAQRGSQPSNSQRRREQDALQKYA